VKQNTALCYYKTASLKVSLHFSGALLQIHNRNWKQTKFWGDRSV